MLWIGVDVGGTFTDLVILDDETGEIRVGKRPSTPARPDEAVLSVIGSAARPDELAAARGFIHGTTIGLNALLERDEGRLALLTTRGFRDVLEIRRGDRAELYNLFWAPPAPLVPRRLRLEITERVGADGSPVVPLVGEDVRVAAARLAEEEIESVAIVFLHSYANPEHELQALSHLREAGFEGDVSLSHATSGEFREYERTCTTVIDAYVRRQVSAYLRRLDDGLASAGFDGLKLITRSGGGAMTFAEAQARPFETILSGPVAGAEGASVLARDMDLNAVVTADVGGTSFDTALIVAGRPHKLYEGVVNGLPVQAPWIDVRSIGAGGGSIAYVDTGGLLRVGPRSAGAVPGPACYGAGGDDATVTDAALVLGMLGDGVLANGTTLDRELASDAVQCLAAELGMSMQDAARGIVEIVTASMANTITEITIDQGEDPRKAVLMAFGGAGPLFATLLARQLGMTRMVVPPHAGNFSAYGLLVADLVQSHARTRIRPVADGVLDDATETLAELFETLGGRLTNGDAGAGETVCEVALDMRYAGQEHTITVDVPCSADGQIAVSAPELLERFSSQYEKTYGSTMDLQVQIITWRATLHTRLPQRRTQPTNGQPAAHGPPAPGRLKTRTLPAYSFAAASTVDFAIVDRASLSANGKVDGPAIVIEDTATTYVDVGFRVEPHRSGALVINQEGAAG
jgi:N-methylhydantoinase A